MRRKEHHAHVIVRELERLPEQDLDKLLGFLRSLKVDSAHAENAELTLAAAESALVKDWLTAEEDEPRGQFVKGDVVVLNFRFSARPQ